MAKLVENTFRAVNIALANISPTPRANGVDVIEVIGAAATKPYGFMAFYPGPGVGGRATRGARVLVVKVAYKTGVADIREVTGASRPQSATFATRAPRTQAQLLTPDLVGSRHPDVRTLPRIPVAHDGGAEDPVAQVADHGQVPLEFHALRVALGGRDLFFGNSQHGARPNHLHRASVI